MDDESDESVEPMEEVSLNELGESELERLVRGWRTEAGSWFQRREEAYWKERSVILREEDDVDGRASVTKDEERVLRGGWTVVRLCRYEGSVVVRIQKKTNCNLLAHPTRKCHHTNLLTAKLFHLTEVLLRSFKRWRFYREPVVVCRRWLWKEPAVMCGNWNVRQAMSQQWQRSALIHASSLFRHWSVA